LNRAVSFAVAAELIHTATLVHDDLLDGSVLRRGRETVNSRWGREAALLLGDHLYLKATEILTSDSVLDPGDSEDFRHVYRASNLMLQTAARIFRGEILQHRKRGELSTTEEDYFEIIKSKSASFLSSCCMIGALLDGHVCPGADQHLARYGLNLGVAFQIRDDVLDLMGNEKKIGKAVGSDLREGRLTLPVIHSLANARDGDRELLGSVLKATDKRTSLFARWRKISHGTGHNGFDKKKLQQVRDLLLAHGSIVYSMNIASNFAETAKRDLEAIPDSQAKQSLVSLANHVMTREN
jgi:octaprenyl-diphosphate synthase